MGLSEPSFPRSVSNAPALQRELTHRRDLLEDVVHGKPLLPQGPALHDTACLVRRAQQHLGGWWVARGGGITLGIHTLWGALVLTQAQVLACLIQPPPLPGPLFPQLLTLAPTSQPLWTRTEIHPSATQPEQHMPHQWCPPWWGFAPCCHVVTMGTIVTEWGQLKSSPKDVPVLVSGSVHMSPHTVKGLCRWD